MHIYVSMVGSKEDSSYGHCETQTKEGATISYVAKEKRALRGLA
jgi:hypothetical protein